MRTADPSYSQKHSNLTKEGLPLSEHLHQKAFDNSLQANIIFTVSNGNIIQANRAACKLLGYSKKELLTKKREDLFRISDEKYKAMLKERKSKGGAKADLFLVRKSGKLVPCEISSVIFKDANGTNNSILSVVDLRERILSQKLIDEDNEKLVAINIAFIQSKSAMLQAEENIDWIKSIAKTSYDVIWDWNILTNMISFGRNYEKVFGHKLPGNKIPFNEWMSLFRTEERKMVKKKINEIYESKRNTWEGTYYFTLPDGSSGQVISRANILRDEYKKIVRIIGVIHDISKLRKLEESLEQEISLKEKQIVEAIVESKEIERSNIGKELHDNINQLLGASLLYLDMARKDAENGEIYLIHSSEYTFTAIEEIRKLTKGLTTATIKDFGLCGAIERISRDIMETHPVKIHYVSDHLLEETVNDKFKLNAFRILQEQLNNIIKHAKASEIHIGLSKTNAEFTLSVEDDGVGFDPSKRSNGIGISNIISRAELYKGNAHFISASGKGCKLLVTFPAGEILG